MTWAKFLEAITPSVQSFLYATVTFLLGAGGTLYLATGPKRVANLEPVAPQVQVTRPAVDHTRTQLVAIEGTVGMCVEEIRELRKDMAQARGGKATRVK